MWISLLCLLSVGCLSLPASKKLQHLHQTKKAPLSIWDVDQCLETIRELVVFKQTDSKKRWKEETGYVNKYCDDSMDRCAMAQIKSIWEKSRSSKFDKDKMRIAMRHADQQRSPIYGYCLDMNNYIMNCEESHMCEQDDMLTQKEKARRSHEFPQGWFKIGGYEEELEKFKADMKRAKRSFSFWSLGQCSEEYNLFFPSIDYTNTGNSKTQHLKTCNTLPQRCAMEQIFEIYTKTIYTTEGEKEKKTALPEKWRTEQMLNLAIVQSTKKTSSIYKYCRKIIPLLEVHFQNCMNEGAFSWARLRKDQCRKDVRNEKLGDYTLEQAQANFEKEFAAYLNAKNKKSI